MIVTGGTVGLAEWIFDDRHVLFIFLRNRQEVLDETILCFNKRKTDLSCVQKKLFLTASNHQALGEQQLGDQQGEQEDQEPQQQQQPQQRLLLRQQLQHQQLLNMIITNMI